MSGVRASDWDAAVSALRGASSVVVVCHVDPDGDALGSAVALVNGLRSMGVPALGAVPGGAAPRRYRFLGTDAWLEESLPEPPDVVVTVDCSTAERTGEHARLLDAAGTVVVVDHHDAGRPFGDVRIVEPDEPATTVLVAELLDRLGVVWGPEVATGLYTGLVTDTGWFSYERTSARTHALAGRLIDAGASPPQVAQAIWEDDSFLGLRLSGRILARAVLEPVDLDGTALIWTSVTAEEMREAAVGPSDLEGMVGALRSVGEADVAVFLREDEDGAWRVSMRSRERVDVGSMAQRLGGGGHRLAAGFTSQDSLVKTVSAVRRALNESLGGRGRPSAAL